MSASVVDGWPIASRSTSRPSSTAWEMKISPVALTRVHQRLVVGV